MLLSAAFKAAPAARLELNDAAAIVDDCAHGARLAPLFVVGVFEGSRRPGNNLEEYATVKSQKRGRRRVQKCVRAVLCVHDKI